MFLIFFLQFLYSVVLIIGKFALEISEPVFLTGVRMLVAGGISYSFYKIFSCYKKSEKNTRVFYHHKSDFWLMFVLVVCNIYMTNAFEFLSLNYLNSGKVALAYNLTPFFHALFSYFLFSEKITMKKLIGLIIGLFAMIPLLVFEADVYDTTTKFFGLISLAEITAISGAMSCVFGWIAMKLMMQKGYSIYYLNGTSMIFGSILCFIHAFIFETTPFVKSGYGISFILYSFVLLLLQNVIAYNLHSWLLYRYTATIISFVGFSAPIFTTLMGFFLLHEPITLKFIICSLLIFFGLLLFYMEELKQGYIIKQ